MIVVRGVLLPFLDAVTWGLIKIVHARVSIESRNPNASEREVVRTIVEPLLRLRVWLQHSPQLSGDLTSHGVKIGLSHANNGHVAGTSPLVEHVHVQRGDGLRGRIERMLTVIARTKQPLFFRRDRQEQHRPPRWFTVSERPGQLDQPGGAGGVVGSAVVDLIAGQVLIQTEMVPVRDIHHNFVRHSGSRQPRHHVLRVDGSQRIAHPGLTGHSQFDRSKVARGRFHLLRVKIEPGHLK